MRAVVMAGGEGSRLRPMTVNLPKPLVPVVNVPIMGHIVALLKRHGITDIVTTLHYLADEVQAAFQDGADWGVNITHSIEDTPLGTAGSVKQAEVLLRDDAFVIISGDALTDCDLTAAIEFHKSKGSLATMVLARVPNPLEFGIVILNDDGSIARFLEKPGWGEVFSDTVNTGIYILEPEILGLIQPRVQTDWSKDVFPTLLASGKPIFGYIMSSYWCDIGTLEAYREAQSDVLNGKTTLDIPGELVAPGIWVGQGSAVDEAAELVPPVCIGSNCRIKRGARVSGSVIGDSCLVEEGARIESSVVWDKSYIGNDVEISGGVVGSRTTIKRESRIQDGAVIGDRCLLDVGCTVRPRVKVWPDKTIERGSTLTMSLVVGNRWRGSLFRDTGVAGLSNIEITPEFATRLTMAFGSFLSEGSLVSVSRDSARSSRMIKRSVMAGLLSSGCQVVDLHGQPLPVTRHYVNRNQLDAGINVRKLPGNKRLSLIEFLGRTGEYMPLATERKIEAAFFREDFHRADPDALGMIEDALQPADAYRRDFLALLPDHTPDRKPRIVVDYGFSTVSPIFPSLLARCGIEAVSLNSFNDARSAPRRPVEILDHLSGLQQIVGSLGAELGVLITNEGENMTVVDDQGIGLPGNTLFAAMCQLVVRSWPGAKIVMGVATPQRLETMLASAGACVTRSKAGTRDLMAAACQSGATFAGNEDGGFVFPRLHPGFDAMFGIVSLVKLLQIQHVKLSEVVEGLPEFHVATGTVECPAENKGTVMRMLAENRDSGRKVELVDGIKLYNDDSWILVLPDSFEPVFHLVAESASLVESQSLVTQYKVMIERMRPA